MQALLKRHERACDTVNLVARALVVGVPSEDLIESVNAKAKVFDDLHTILLQLNRSVLGFHRLNNTE